MSVPFTSVLGVRCSVVNLFAVVQNEVDDAGIQKDAPRYIALFQSFSLNG